MNFEKFIIDSINKLQGKYTPYQIFTDWIAMMAIAIQNACSGTHDKVYREREKNYLTIAGRYSKDELKIMADMFGALTVLLDNRFHDFLGEIYMMSDCGSKATGQFFTPYHLSYLIASLGYGDRIEELTDGEMIEVSEPATGGGGMMIAIAQVMEEKGKDYRKQLHVVAQDLDWNGVYMTYIQLSLLGVKAIVVQGDSLCEPYKLGYDEKRVFRTPAEMGVIG